MKEIIWSVRVKSAPTAVRYCKRCNSPREFVSSGCFRVNAQQKRLDVWLVYNCAACGTSWNLTVLSRIAPRSIPPDLLQGFHDNDSDLAIRFATDADLIKRCGAEPGVPEIEVIGKEIDRSELLQIHLVPESPLNIKAEGVLRKKLGLSHSKFIQLLESSTLECISGHDLRKCKLREEIIIKLKPE